LFQDINIEQLFEMQAKGDVTLIDVRSPSEYEDSTIPGSINIPLFDNAERAEIGTLYTQVNNQAAKDRGLEIVSAKLPAFVRSFAQISTPKVLYCWRGGMRSRTTATLLSLMDIHVCRLEGGFRSYRKWVIDTLERFELRPKTFVIHGNTGSGKTIILRKLKERGYPVIDLEGIAGHRGSIFGHIGLKTNNQKTFESFLLQDLLRFQDSPYILLEAESKRVGKVVLPEFLIHAKEQGSPLVLETPMAERVRHILEDYRPQEHKEECIASFKTIKQRLHTPIAAEVEQHLVAERYAEAVYLLLEHYYDPRYEHTIKDNSIERIMIRCNHIDEAVEAIISHLDEIPHHLVKSKSMLGP